MITRYVIVIFIWWIPFILSGNLDDIFFLINVDLIVVIHEIRAIHDLIHDQSKDENSCYYSMMYVLVFITLFTELILYSYYNQIYLIVYL